MTTVDWTPERTDTLVSLWKSGLPTSEIGRRLGVTKNAVVGKVHRLGLPKRQSPIRAAAEDAPPKVVKLEGLGAGMCCWPIGEPGTADFRFCGKPSVPGKPYCDEHCAKAYVRASKDRKESTAAA